MNQDEYVIFAELDRAKFEEILARLRLHFQNIEFGRQGDDYIWVHFSNSKIEIDTFYSMNLEVKAQRGQYPLCKEILSCLNNEWIIQEFIPPKVDLTK
jgi:hypothetical protein